MNFQTFQQWRTRLPRRGSLLLWGVSLAALIALAGILNLPALLDKMEASLLDARLKARAGLFTASEDIIVVGLDQRTQNEALNEGNAALADRALPRAELAKIIRHLAAQGAKAIVLDVEFLSARDRAGDDALTAAIGETGNVYVASAVEMTMASARERILSGETGDRNAASMPKAELDTAMRQVCLQDLYRRKYKSSPQTLDLIRRHGLNVRVSPPAMADAFLDEVSYCIARPVVPQVLAAAKGMGYATLEYHGDAYVRDIPLLYRTYAGSMHAYIGFRPVPDLLGLREIGIQAPDTLALGERKIPLIEKGNVLINWRDPKNLVERLFTRNKTDLPDAQRNLVSAEKGNKWLGSGHLYRMVSAIDLLRDIEGKAAEKPSLYNLYGMPGSGKLDFKNKVFVYGDTIKDTHRTPVSTKVFGPEIVATVLDMLWHDKQFVQKVPPWSVALGVLLVSGLMGYALIMSPRLLIGMIAALLLIALYWAYNFVAFMHLGWWIPLVTPSLILGLVLIASLVYRYYVHDSEKRQLTRIFAKYVSPQVMDRILANPAMALDNLNGTRKELTVLFSDLRGFTSHFESEDPETMVRQLNEYFTAMTRVILRHQGTYDKFMGDAIMAFFGAPAEVPNHAEKACAAALDMLETLDALNAKWKREGLRELGIGVGLSTGEMIVGNFGSDDLVNFTVMGSAVNLGSRLESATRTVGAPIVISERTVELAGNAIVSRSLGEIPVKGFQKPVPVFALERMKTDIHPEAQDSSAAKQGKAS